MKAIYIFLIYFFCLPSNIIAQEIQSSYKISREETNSFIHLIDNDAPIPKPECNSPQITYRISSYIGIKTKKFKKQFGYIDKISERELVFLAGDSNSSKSIVVRDTLKIEFKDIEAIWLPHNMSEKKVVLGTLIPLGIGALTGFLMGDDDPNAFFAFSAGEKALLLGGPLGAIGFMVYSLTNIFSGVDAHLPWNFTSSDDRFQMLGEIKSGAFEAPKYLRLVPFIGITKHDKADNTIMGGIGLRLLPKAHMGFEFGIAQVDCYDLPDEIHWATIKLNKRKRLTFYYAQVHSSVLIGNRLSPYIQFGIGGTASVLDYMRHNKLPNEGFDITEVRKTERSFIGIASVGVEYQFTRRIRTGIKTCVISFSEGKHLSYQLSVIFGK